MSNYSLGVAQGAIVITYDGAGVAKAEASVAKLEATTKRASGTLAASSKSMAVAGAVIAGGLAVAANEATQFQSKMQLLVTAAGESPAKLNEVAAGVEAIAIKTGTALGDLSDGAYEIEKAGYRGADALNVLKAAAEGARAEGAPLNVMGNALTSVMMSYHLHASDAVSTTNMLVAAAGRSKTTMQDFAAALSTVLPVASAAGVSFPQLAGAIATLTQHGTSAAEATQEISSSVRGLMAPSGVAVKAMNQIGLSVNGVSQMLKDPNVGLSGAIDHIEHAITSKMGPSGLVVVDAMNKSKSAAQDLQVMLKNMPPTLQSLSNQFLSGHLSMTDYRKSIRGMGVDGAAMGSNFLQLAMQSRGFNQYLKSGTPAARTFASMLRDVMGGAIGMNTALMLSGENMPYFTKTTDEVAAAARRGGTDISTWAKTSQTASVQFGQFKATLQVLAVQIGAIVLPALVKIAGAFRTLFNWFIAIPGPIKSFLVYAGLLASSLLLGAFVISKFILIGGKLVDGVRAMGRAFSSLITFIQSVLTRLGILGTAEEASATETEAANARRSASYARYVAAQEAATAKIMAAQAEMDAAQTEAAIAAEQSGSKQIAAASRVAAAQERLAAVTVEANAEMRAAEMEMVAASSVDTARIEAVLNNQAAAHERLAAIVSRTQAEITAAEADAAIASQGSADEITAAQARVAAAHERAATLVGAATARVETADAAAAAAEGEMAAATTTAMSEAAAAHEAESAAIVAANERVAASNLAAGASGAAGAGGIARMMGTMGGAATAAVAFGIGVYALGKTISNWTDSAFNAGQAAVSSFGQAMHGLTSALVENNGALNDNIKLQIGEALQQNGMAGKAAAAGISLAQLRDGITGNAAAYNKLVAAWKAGGSPSDDTLFALTLMQKQYHGTAAGARTLAASVKNDGTQTARVVPLTNAHRAAINNRTTAYLRAITAAHNDATTQQNNRTALDAGTTAMDRQKLAADVLAAALGKLAGQALDAHQQELQLKDGIAQASAQYKQNGSSLSENTNKGRANQEWLLNQITAIHGVANAQKAAGDSTKTINDTYKANIAALKAAATAAHLNADQVQTLIDKYAGVPKTVATKVTSSTESAWANVAGLIGRINNANPTLMVHIKTTGGSITIGGRSASGPSGFAEGGGIHGPGTGTSDSIIARVSNDEHIWTAAEVHGAGGHGEVERLRAYARRRAMRNYMPRFATGGAVKFDASRVAGAIGAIGSGYNDPISVTGTGMARIRAQIANAVDVLNQEIAKGLKGAAADSLRAQITHAAVDANRQLSNLRVHIRTSDLAGIRSALSKTADDTRAAFANLLPDLSKMGASSTLLATLRAEEGRLISLQNQRASVTTRLAAATAKYNEILSTVRTTITDYYNAADAVAGVLQTVAAATEKVSTTQSNSGVDFGGKSQTTTVTKGPDTSGAILADEQAKAANAAKFVTGMKALKSWLPARYYAELLSRGPDALPTVTALLGLSASQRTAYAAAAQSIYNSGTALGTAEATSAEGATIRTLTAQQRVLNTTISRGLATLGRQVTISLNYNARTNNALLRSLIARISHYAVGGWTGGTELAIVHPNEYMLSAGMLRGTQAIDPRVLGMLSRAQIAAMSSGRQGFGSASSSRTPQASATSASLSMPPINLQARVFVGDREITDIVRTEVSGTLAPLETMSRAGAF